MLAGVAGFGARTSNFDSVPPGSPPAGWFFPEARPSEKPGWLIRRDDTAPSKPNVLAQISARGPAISNVASFQNGDVSVTFKTVWGRKSQSAGLVWRYQDERNYYLLRADALANEIVLYKVQDGRRVSIVPRRHRIPGHTWQILKVTFRGPRFEVYFDHRRVFVGDDETFLQAGRVGLWAMPGTVTYFDDFRASPR